MNDFQQAIYDHLMDEPPVTQLVDGSYKRELGTPAKEAFWHGVDNYQLFHKRYVRDSAIYGALVAGHHSYERTAVRQAQ